MNIPRKYLKDYMTLKPIIVTGHMYFESVHRLYILSISNIIYARGNLSGIA